MVYNLRNRNILVTGGSRYEGFEDAPRLTNYSIYRWSVHVAYVQPSRGLGAVVAEKFAAEGSNVAINFANREEPAVELAGRLKKDYGAETTAIQGVCVFKGKECEGIW